ncbi:hypothetical protein D915_009463 [Fasciola hepatica]|uniref:Uncharacterized protein n=1 Tax=Fasciola hepatica TaxID=6192 RepID=A0A4E0REN7_FASHE|nr:hypothetical protein D915_009463 [Fasciola hepatica]
MITNVVIAEHYLYTADKRDMNSLIFFGNKDKEPLKISEDDFPVNEVANEVSSPGYITGRIKPGYVDQSQHVQQEVFEFDELNPQELVLETPDDKLKTFVEEKASKPNATSSASRDAEPVRLAETLAHKLDLTDQSRDLSTPMKMMASSNSLIASPSKPIDRKPLLIEYQDRCKQEKDKEIINLIVLGKSIL